MTAFIRLFNPDFNPAPTVERLSAVPRMADGPEEDIAQRDQWINETFDLRPSSRS